MAYSSSVGPQAPVLETVQDLALFISSPGCPSVSFIIFFVINWWKVKESLSRVWLFATPWTLVHQAPLSMRFPRQEYWNGLPFSSPGDLPDPGMEPGSPSLQADSLPSETPNWPMRVNVSLSFTSHANKWANRGRSWFIAVWSEAPMTTWTCDWVQSSGTEPLTCGIRGYLQLNKGPVYLVPL